MQEIKFNNHIYDKRAVARAITDFSHLAKFKVTMAAGYTRVVISNEDPGLKAVLKDEFCNYVLGVTKQCLRQ